jgi:hypothetical protein
MPPMLKGSHPKPTDLYRTFWKFASERQRILIAQANGSRPPHTLDPVLLKYRFTNAYRAADRVSQYLIRHVLYQGDTSPDEVVFRSLIFRTFNRIETWEYLAQCLGPITYKTFDPNRYAGVLDAVFASGKTIYSPAYIMPSQCGTFAEPRKHRNHLNLIQFMMRSDLTTQLEDARSLKEVFQTYYQYPMFGPFLAFQFAIDINYSRIVDFSEMDYVVAGPGARSGLHKCFHVSNSWSDDDTIRYVTDNQEVDSKAFGEHFESLWGRPLQLIDVQNLFCEVDKYTRVSHPGAQGIGGRTRIKRLYSPAPQQIEYWFPPKWHLKR